MTKDNFSTKIISLLIPLTLVTVVASIYVKDQQRLRATGAIEAPGSALRRPTVRAQDVQYETAWVQVAKVVFTPIVLVGKAVEQIPRVPEALRMFGLVPVWFFLLAGMFIYESVWVRVLCGYFLIGSFVVPLLYFGNYLR